MLRVGLVGCGFIGRVHSLGLWALRTAGVGGAAVTAVCDDDADRAASLARPNGAAVADLDALASSVDAVYVCTPTAGHIDAVRAAARAGAAVYCEKPLGRDLEGARDVARVLASTPHQVGLVLRCAPVFQCLRDVLASGRYGRPMSAVLRDDQFFPISGHYASAWRADVDVAGGGTLIEHSIHDLDLLRWLLGEVSEVSGRTSSFFGHRGVEDNATVTMSHACGATATVVSVWHNVTTRASTRRLEVFCEDAMVWTDDDNCGPLHVETSAGHEVVPCDPPAWVDALPVEASARRGLGLYAEASRRFLASVEEGSAGSPGEGEAMAAHELVDAAYRSAAEGGRPVSVSERPPS